MNKYYVTLVYELHGHCIVAFSPDESKLRAHLSKYYGRLWCSIYTEQPTEKIIGSPLYIGEDD